MTYFVRTWLLEDDQPVYSDDGPYDRYLAELVLADIAIDASIQHGFSLQTNSPACVRVERAVLVEANEGAAQ